MIGLIGGLGTNAGVHYYEQLAQRHRFSKRPFDLVLIHADLSIVLDCVNRDDRVALAHYLSGLIKSLAAAGATVAAITAVAPHICIAELDRLSPIPVIDVVRVVAAHMSTLRYKRVAVFGNRAVVESNIFGAVPECLVVPNTPENIAAIHEIYNDIALHGKRAPGGDAKLLEERADFVMAQHGAEAIILAGTDLSSFYAGSPPPYPFIDVALWHLDAIESTYIGR